MNNNVLKFSPRKLLIGVATALAVTAVVLLASHSVARTAPGSERTTCASSQYETGQPIVLASVDGTGSTDTAAVRALYARTLAGVASAATKQGAYLIVTVFGSTNGNIKLLCATSTRVAGAAPLFVTAQQTALRQSLQKLAGASSRVKMGNAGSSIYGAFVDGIQRVQLLRAGTAVPATVVVITDGDEAADGVHLRLRLDSGTSDAAIASQIVRTLPPVDARGLAITMEGVGHLGGGHQLSTRDVARMQDVWARVCASTRARRCLVTADLLNYLS